MKKEKLLNAIGQIDDKLIADAKPKVGTRQKRVRVQWLTALAACLILIMCVGVITPLSLGNRVAGTVTMEINPGVEYVIARNGNVKSVRFLNDDAKDVLGKASLKGQSLKNALNLTLAAYKLGGYLDRNDTVLISFDKQLSKNAKLKASVSDDVRKALENTNSVHAMVCVSETDNPAAAEIAERYNISQGKAKLISDAAEKSELTVEELVNVPLDELVDLQKVTEIDVISKRFIGMTKAKQIALNDAGVTARVTFTEAVLVDGGIKTPYYRLVFCDNRTQWTYRIDATNGAILERNKTELFISLEEAKIIALKFTGLYENAVAEKIVFTKEELNRNQGRPCWILEFYTTQFQYSLKIDARTGDVFYFDYHIDIREAKEIALKDAGCIDSEEKITFTVEEYVGGGVKTPYFYFVFNNDVSQWYYRIDATLGIIIECKKEDLLIPLQKAKEIALNDAGVSDPNEVVFTVEELNRNQGQPCWVLEFHNEKYQFSYKIDAKTGDIIFSRRFITMANAKRIALNDANCPDDEKVVFTVEKLVDGGIKTPYYLFQFNDGQTQWTYRICATRGSIIFSEVTNMMITLQKAKEIALKDAGISDPSEAVFTVELLHRNQGKPCWVLEFHTKKEQFSYKIDAFSGEIIYSRRYIRIDIAKEIALNDCGFVTGERVEFTAQELIDNGAKYPHYYLVFNNGIVEWTYYVNATNGEILFKSYAFIRGVILPT